MYRKTSRHHRRPVSHGGNSKTYNISYVSPQAHQAWHRLFGNSKPQEIADTINAVWLDYEFEFIVRRRK